MVRDVVDHEPSELALVRDDDAVEELASQTRGPAFGAGVDYGAMNRSLENLEALRQKNTSTSLMNWGGGLPGVIGPGRTDWDDRRRRCGRHGWSRRRSGWR